MAAQTILTDPDEDDVSEAVIKVRENENGTGRGKIEIELLDVTPGTQYTIRVEVEEAGVPVPPIVVGPLTAKLR